MSESDLHVVQVNAIEGFIKHLKADRTDLVLYRDIATVDKQKLPRIIRGFRPDLLARFWKSDEFYIGEGKTTFDLETSHTRDQVYAFSLELAENGSAGLILCAPFEAQARARGLLWEICTKKLIETREIYCIFPGLDDISVARLSRKL